MGLELERMIGIVAQSVSETLRYFAPHPKSRDSAPGLCLPCPVPEAGGNINIRLYCIADFTAGLTTLPDALNRTFSRLRKRGVVKSRTCNQHAGCG
jgi:hypothetical protein